MARVLAVCFLSISLSLPGVSPAIPANGVLYIDSDYLQGYDRKYFKHWVDEDKDNCDTRAEVLIEEAVIQPKINKKNCALTGGKWVSPYDNKTHTKASALDIDHLVPLAEAWRSGAWNWTPSQRQAFANDLSESRALVAVTLSLNRSKGDKDVSNWLPKVNLCEYVQSWLIVKTKYSLSVDSIEGSKLNELIVQCNLNFLIIERKKIIPTPTPTPNSLEQPVDVTDRECPRILKINLDKQNLLPNESTVLRILYEDDKNSFDVSTSGYSNWTKPNTLGTLEGGSPKLSKFKIKKSEKLDGRIREEMEATLIAPTGEGVWKFGFLQIYDRGGNWISFEGGNQLCSLRGYISAPDYNLDISVATPTSKPTPTPTPTPTPINSSSPTKTSAAIRTYELVPTFSMTTYSEQLRRYKDRPDGYLYIHQTRGVVQVRLPALPTLDPNSQYFVVIGGGTVANRACESGNLQLPLDAKAERDKQSVLYSLLPRGPKGLPVGIVFKVSTFPIAFTCYFGNEIKYSVSVVETDNLFTTIKSQSRAVEFLTPILWMNLPQPTASPSQIDTFAITPNAVCMPDGTKVVSTDGKSYVCKKSDSDGQLRWTS